MVTINSKSYGTREKLENDVIQYEEDCRIIPMHKETKESMKLWSDEYLVQYRNMIYELKLRGSGQVWMREKRLYLQLV